MPFLSLPLTYPHAPTLETVSRPDTATPFYLAMVLETMYIILMMNIVSIQFPNSLYFCSYYCITRVFTEILLFENPS